MAFSETEQPLHAEAVTRFLVLDPASRGTIRSHIWNARENLRAVRELVSTELWESINAFHLELQGRDVGSDIAGEPHVLYSMIKTRCQAVAGVAVETMPRDEGWHLLNLGWMLERAVMTCRLLSRSEEHRSELQSLMRN